LSGLGTEGDRIGYLKPFFFTLAADEFLGQPFFLFSENPIISIHYLEV